MTKIVAGHSVPFTPVATARAINLRYFNIALFALLVVLGACYLVNISRLTVQGFVLRELKDQVSELARAQAAAEEAVNQAQSYASLQARLPELKMVAIDKIDYLSAGSLAMARK